jgi:hypothetical protein
MRRASRDRAGQKRGRIWRHPRFGCVKNLVLAVFTFLSLVVLAPNASAERSPVAQEEINHLIAFVENSGLHFIRNGSEHDAKASADHLRDKLGQAGARVKSADDFIVGVASKSYLSGKPYLVRMRDGKEQPTGPWLSEELARYRAGKQKTDGAKS